LSPAKCCSGSEVSFVCLATNVRVDPQLLPRAGAAPERLSDTDYLEVPIVVLIKLRLLTSQKYIPLLLIGSSLPRRVLRGSPSSRRIRGSAPTGIRYRSSNDPGSRAD